jgi:hypothetical protein
MSKDHQITFYPVGNGDAVQIVLVNDRRILFDFNHISSTEEDDTPVIDLKVRLRHELKEAGRDSFDVVAFTHADRDHIQGSTEFFELWHAKKYQGEGRVKIDELWVPAAMLLEKIERDKMSDEFAILRQEARHRLLKGKGIHVFSRPPELIDWLVEQGVGEHDRDNLFVDAGTLVGGFSKEKDGVEFFCHSPFIEHCDDGDIVRNDASLVFNVRFHGEGGDCDFLQVGDTAWKTLEQIVQITLDHKNEDRLAWNLFNIPHHCSYKALSDEKGERETDPKPLVKKLLQMGKPEAYMVSSSNPIPDKKESYKSEQPPHIQARKAYEKFLADVGGRQFLVTMEKPDEERPQPLRFEVSKGGITWQRSRALGATLIANSRPPRAGR